MTVDYWRLATIILYTASVMWIAGWIVAAVYVTIKRLTGIEIALERIADRMEKRCSLQCDKANEAKDETPCSG